ncbi:Putative sodium-coupled neutral amino acid transporter 9 [Chelonia mydas]|uniref:Putative sodium-coupled neutral amino acid transporter 9 n=1 Tax=Chelonia mydas TaxID=8469 RepID=M7CK01_CHEMY|nr:Putative sodium-coupled neutral amino acid transporter 9 [Chelonia mydas]
MEEDTKPLLIPVGGDERDYGIMNIQFDPADLKCKRPFHVEPSNIVSVNDDTQRVTDEASAMNKRIHYYSKLTSPSDRALIYDLEYNDGHIYTKYALGYKTDYVHDINVTDLVPGTNGSNRVICPGTANKDQPGNRSGMFASVNNTSFELFEEWWSKSRTVPFYLIVVVLPLLNLKSPSFFAKFNILGTFSVVYLVFLVTLKAAHLGFHLEFNWFTANEFFVPEFRIQFPQLTGVLTLAFFIHNCVITLLKNNKNQENNVRDLSIAYFLVGLTYLYVGLLIFAAFPSPPLSKECIEQMITVYPLLGYLARVQLLGHIFGNVYPSIFHVLVLNIAIVGLGVTMAIFYPNIGGIIRYSGATCGLAFVFVYPSLIYMISLHQSGQLTWSTLIVHIFILILGLANLIAQFLL